MTWEPSGFKVSEYVGRVVAPAEDKLDGKVTELRIAVSHGYKNKDDGTYVQTGTTFVTHSANADYAGPLKAVGQGDLVKVSGNPQLTTRNYDKADGTKGAAVESRFGTVELLEKKGESTGGASTGGFDGAPGAF